MANSFYDVLLVDHNATLDEIMTCPTRESAENFSGEVMKPGVASRGGKGMALRGLVSDLLRSIKIREV